MDPNVTTAPSAPPSTPSPRVINVTPSAQPPPSPSSWRNRRNLTFGLIGALVLVAGLATSLVLVRRQQQIGSKAAGPNSISAVCQGGNPPRGLLVVHQFDSQTACDNCKNDPSDCVRRLVGQPSDHNVCPAGNNYIGTTTNPYDGKANVCTDLGDCSGGSCTATFPNCAAVQIDCLNGLGGGINAGNPTINCGGCSTPPPPPPAVDCQCHSVVADKDLSSLKIGDTVNFTGFGWVSSDTDAIDKIEFLIQKDGLTLATDQPTATRAAEKDSGNQRFWKATESFTATQAGTYTVKIRVHWQSQNVWKE